MTKSIPVFRAGKWIFFNLENTDPLWTYASQLRAASAYATAVSKGYQHQEAMNLAEAFINKEVYRGIVYTPDIERKLLALTDRAGIA